jgi:hypothetical protein
MKTPNRRAEIERSSELQELFYKNDLYVKNVIQIASKYEESNFLEGKKKSKLNNKELVVWYLITKTKIFIWQNPKEPVN